MTSSGGAHFIRELNSTIMDRARYLEMLVRAADCGSFAEAARKLDVTPSAVSRGIAELERSLRSPLFNRTTRQLRLTEDGARVYERAREVLDRLDAIEACVMQARTRVTGTVRVGIPAPLNRYVLMPALPAFIERYPDVRLDVRTAQDPRALHLENLDVLFHVGALRDSRMVARLLGYGRPAAYASRAYLDRHGAPHEPDDLAAHRCLVFRPPWLVRERDEWTFRLGADLRTVPVRPAIVSGDREGLLVAALRGAGVVYLACFDPALIGPAGLVRLLPEWSCDDSFEIRMLHRSASRMPSRVRAFLDFAEQAFRAFDPEERTIRHHSPGRKRLAVGTAA